MSFLHTKGRTTFTYEGLSGREIDLLMRDTRIVSMEHNPPNAVTVLDGDRTETRFKHDVP